MHGLEVRIDTGVGRIDDHGAPVEFFQECAGCRSPGPVVTIVIAITCWYDQIIIRVIKRVVAIVPVVASKRATRQRVLHDVEELAVAPVELPLAVVQHIPRRAKARSNLVGETKIDLAGARGVGR